MEDIDDDDDNDDYDDDGDDVDDGDDDADDDGDDDDDYAPTSPPWAKIAPEGTHRHESWTIRQRIISGVRFRTPNPRSKHRTRRHTQPRDLDHSIRREPPQESENRISSPWGQHTYVVPEGTHNHETWNIRWGIASEVQK